MSTGHWIQHIREPSRLLLAWQSSDLSAGAERTRFAVGGALLVVALAVVLPAAVMAGDDGAAAVQFGTADVGSPFPVGPPPIPSHDSSPNAQFNLVPRTAVVAQNGIVTFTIGGGGPTDKIVRHQVAVCASGVGPDDVVIPAGAPFQINDPRCVTHGPPTTSGSVPVQFTAPGRYLVICNIRPHFVEFKMYGWVNVK